MSVIHRVVTSASRSGRGRGRGGGASHDGPGVSGRAPAFIHREPAQQFRLSRRPFRRTGTSTRTGWPSSGRAGACCSAATSWSATSTTGPTCRARGPRSWRSPRRALTQFAQISAASLPGSCPGGVGLTTALSVLPGGWVVVGSTPSTDGTAATAKAGCLIVLDSHGHGAGDHLRPRHQRPVGHDRVQRRAAVRAVRHQRAQRDRRGERERGQPGHGAEAAGADAP